MKQKEYIRPALRYINIQGDVLLVCSNCQISVDQQEGVWEADANEEGRFGSIWDSADKTLQK